MEQRPNLSVCIDAVFEGVPEEEAIDAVARCGFPAIEFWAWWEKDLDQIKHLADQRELKIASMCTKFISLVDNSQRSHYIDGLKESIAAAAKVGCSTLISQVGDTLPGISREIQRESLIDGLLEAKPLLESSDVTLVIEPLNDRIDHKGYYLVHSDEAFEIIDVVDSEHVKVVFDIYHQQISEGHVIERFTENIRKISHFHAAGNPGRNELTVGELSYPNIFSAIVKAGYDRYIGLEYWPLGDAEAGLREVASWFASS